MADVATALGTDMAANALVAVSYPQSAGIPYSLDFMPDLPDAVVALYEDPAGPVKADTVQVAIQVSVRAATAGDARTLAWQIHDRYARSGFTVSGRRYTSYARGVPSKLLEDETGRTVYVLNLTLVTAI